jgi:hypothetical protein
VEWNVEGYDFKKSITCKSLFIIAVLFKRLLTICKM